MKLIFLSGLMILHYSCLCQTSDSVINALFNNIAIGNERSDIENALGKAHIPVQQAQKGSIKFQINGYQAHFVFDSLNRLLNYLLVMRDTNCADLNFDDVRDLKPGSTDLKTALRSFGSPQELRWERDVIAYNFFDCNSKNLNIVFSKSLNGTVIESFIYNERTSKNKKLTTDKISRIRKGTGLRELQRLLGEPQEISAIGQKQWWLYRTTSRNAVVFLIDSDNKIIEISKSN